MAGACVIGVDVGGTKLLAGAVDAGLGVHHRAQRSSQELETGELLDVLAAMVREAADAAPGPVLGAGFGLPIVLDRRTGIIAACPHLPLEGVRFQALMEERLGIPVAVDNDANCALLAEWRHGAGVGCDDVVMITVGTGIGGGIVSGGQLIRGASGGAGELGHMVVQLDGPPCQGQCPGRGHLEVYASGNAIGRAGVAMLAEHPESALAREAAAGREVTGALVTELAHDGDPAARAAVEQVGRALGAGMVTIVNIFNPERILVGGGGIAAGELLLGPARREVAECAMPSLRDVVEIVPARFGADAGLLGAATLAFEEFGQLTSPAAGRLIVCPTPIGNLEDITLRTLAALREADVIACEDTRTSKVLLDRYSVSATRVRYDSHAERRAAPRLVERMRAGETVALVSDAGMPLVSDPGLVLVQAAVAAGIAVEVLPGPSAALTALVASGMPAETWRFVGFLPRRRGELEELLRAEETLVAFESPRRVGATLAVLGELDPVRPVALCRELTKLHEEIVRGSAAELAERYASEAPRGEVVLVIGPAEAGAADRAAAIDAVQKLVESGARPRAAAGVVAGLTGVPANALYAAVVAGDS